MTRAVDTQCPAAWTSRAFPAPTDTKGPSNDRS